MIYSHVLPKKLLNTIEDCIQQKMICEAKAKSNKVQFNIDKEITWLSSRPGIKSLLMNRSRKENWSHKRITSIITDETLQYLRVFTIEKSRTINNLQYLNFSVKAIEDLLVLSNPIDQPCSPDESLHVKGKKIEYVEECKNTISQVSGNRYYDQMKPMLEQCIEDKHLHMFEFIHQENCIAFVNNFQYKNVAIILHIGISPEFSSVNLLLNLINTTVNNSFRHGCEAIVLQTPVNATEIYKPLGFKRLASLKMHEWSRATDYCVAKARAHPSTHPASNVLKKTEEFVRSFQETKLLGIPYHEDIPKNWDSLAALSLILRYTNLQAKVLDAGGEYYSSILPQLASYGYEHLTCMNFAFKHESKKGTIIYRPGDITKTGFSRNSFEVITCLSVIEHGIDLVEFFNEMSRVLKPGGLLFISTDYWEERVDTKNAVAYGFPTYIFTPDDITNIVNQAGDYGLQLIDPLILDCEDKVVEWQEFGLLYTFVYFTFQKIK